MIINFFNTFVNIPDEDTYLKEIANNLDRKDKKTFFYLNSYSFYLANKNKDFENAFKKADYIIADGISIIQGIRWLHNVSISKVVFTHSLTGKLGFLLVERKCKIFCLGGKNEVIANAVEKLKKDFPGIYISSYHQGYFDTNTESEKIISTINNSNADVLIVGMGMPRSEIWIQENLSRINTNLIFSVGGFFDFMAGKKKLAPKWIRNTGFEWIFRLLQEPWRLLRRYCTVHPYFVYRVIKEKIRSI